MRNSEDDFGLEIVARGVAEQGKGPRRGHKGAGNVDKRNRQTQAKHDTQTQAKHDPGSGQQDTGFARAAPHLER